MNSVVHSLPSPFSHNPVSLAEIIHRLLLIASIVASLMYIHHATFPILHRIRKQRKEKGGKAATKARPPTLRRGIRDSTPLPGQ